jgi:hypothetical protein
MAVQTPTPPKVRPAATVPDVDRYAKPSPSSRVHIPNGAACAALIAAGIGSLVLGLLTTGAEIFAPLKTFLNFYNPVGPLAGKTTYAVLAFFISWPVLHNMWKTREMDFNRYMTYTLVLTGIGFLLTFPLVFEAFAH